MHIQFRVAAALMVVATCPVSALAQETPKDEKRICRPETSTGSVLPKRICKTRGEWAASARKNAETAQNSMGKMQGARLGKPGE